MSNHGTAGNRDAGSFVNSAVKPCSHLASTRTTAKDWFRSEVERGIKE